MTMAICLFSVCSNNNVNGTQLIKVFENSEPSFLGGTQYAIAFLDNGKCLFREIDFIDDSRCSVGETDWHCSLSNVEALSEFLHSYYKESFTIGYIKPHDNSILFHDFKTTNREFKLSLASESVKDLVFDCRENKVEFPIINGLYNISHIYINSNVPEKIVFPTSMISPDILSKCYLNNKPIF